jgi:hypothetical protein
MRLMRDLQGCIDSTNELLKRIEGAAHWRQSDRPDIVRP